MRSTQRTVLLALCLMLAVTSAHASVIYLNSNTTAVDPRQTNSQSGGNVSIIPQTPAWHPNGTDAAGNPYIWISFTNSGVGGTTLPNASSVDQPPTAIFYLDFSLQQDALAGILTLWADDTARVYMDDTLLIDPYPTQGSACAGGPPSCATDNGAILDLTHLGLQAGDHQLRIEAYQRSGSVFGVQYSGFIQEQVPEPATFGLLGTILVGLGLVVRRKRHSGKV